MSGITEEAEATTRQNIEEQIRSVVPRDLLPTSAYAPIPGIYDVGWKLWKELPEADFAREMREFDDSIINENKEWVMRYSPMLANGELSLEQVKLSELQSYLGVDNFPITIVNHVYHNLKNKEVRDIILRHTAEEVGHAELKADFLVYGFGLDRVRDVWNGKPNLSKPINFGGSFPAIDALRKESPSLAYATVPFLERNLPLMNQIQGRALREKYGFPDKVLGFYDLHSYVDIYHERLALYIMAKYSASKKAHELFRNAIEQIRNEHIEVFQAQYRALKAL